MTNFKPKGSMHDNRLRYQYYPVESGRMVKLSIHHRDGGRNYFSGANEARGIEMAISTIEIADSGVSGIRMESMSPMDDGNGRILLLELPRYSAKKLEQMVRLFDEHAPEISALWSVDRSLAFARIQSIAAGDARLAA